MTDTWRKVLFYGLAAGILGLKVLGFVKGKLPWYLIIGLAAAGIVTEPTPLQADSITGRQAQGLPI